MAIFFSDVIDDVLGLVVSVRAAEIDTVKVAVLSFDEDVVAAKYHNEGFLMNALKVFVLLGLCRKDLVAFAALVGLYRIYINDENNYFFYKKKGKILYHFSGKLSDQ